MEKAFTAYQSYLTLIDQLSEAERGRLFTAALQYGTSGEESDLRGNERIVWATVKNDIDREKEPQTVAPKKKLTRASPSRFEKPTIEEITEYVKERGNTVSPQKFFDFYESKGWKVGNQPMKDWQAAVRTWEQRDRNPSHGSGKRSIKQMYPQHEQSDADLSHLLVDLDKEPEA